MDKFFSSICGTAFWNPKAVYSDHPDFTFCFQNTVLLWIPCLVLWIIGKLNTETKLVIKIFKFYNSKRLYGYIC